MTDARDIPLYRRFPALRSVERLPLAQLPTPVDEAANLASRYGVGRLFIKRDDLTAEPYGGNKVRKLEFLLPAVEAAGAKSIVTIGAAGSNHVLATAIYARRLGLNTTAVVFPQPPSSYMKRNLAADVGQGADFSWSGHMFGVPIAGLRAWLQARRKHGGSPYYIPPGGSNALSCLGYVNAALELAEQIRDGELPEPDVCFVTVGTGGTAAGLLAGFALAGLKTKVVGVRVVDRLVSNHSMVFRLATGVSRLIADITGKGRPPLNPFEMEHRLFGGQYALFTPEALQAVDDARQTEGLKLEGTYTGKTMAALKMWAAEGRLKGKNVLFWHTYNSRDTSALAAENDWISRLPAPLAELAQRPDHDAPAGR